MSKLELTFTDEVGTNLNQYKMKRNVGTASETEEVIQLERDANITTQGTIINADKLNKMVCLNAQKENQNKNLNSLTRYY